MGAVLEDIGPLSVGCGEAPLGMFEGTPWLKVGSGDVTMVGELVGLEVGVVDSFKLVGMLLGDVGAPLGTLEDKMGWLGVGSVLFDSVEVGSVDVTMVGELVGL